MSKEIQQWEYEILFETPILPSNKSIKKGRFNDMGSEGWELVSVYNVNSLTAFTIFKRPKQQP